MLYHMYPKIHDDMFCLSLSLQPLLCELINIKEIK